MSVMDDMISEKDNNNMAGGFMLEADLRGQADPTAFFDYIIRRVFSDIDCKRPQKPGPGEGSAEAERQIPPSVLIVSEKSAARRAMEFCLRKAGVNVFTAGPSDSYNYMLDVIINENVCLLISDCAGVSGILKHSAELKLDAVMISDRFVPQSLADPIVKAWGCDVYMHYTRPELAGLGAFGPLHITLEAEDEADKKYGTEGLAVCDELRIEIIDPETGNSLSCRKSLTGKVSPGRWGEIVITSLFPAAEPMIDYRTGDVSRMVYEDASGGGQIIDITKKRASM